MPLTELLKQPSSTWQKIVARCRDGRILQGYTNDFQVTKRGLTISPTPFAPAARDVSMSDLDSIFFMRDSALGQPESKQAAQTLGRRVAVTLGPSDRTVGPSDRTVAPSPHRPLAPLHRCATLNHPPPSSVTLH